MKFGESLKARNYRFSIIEIKINVILYNLSGLMNPVAVLTSAEEFCNAEKKEFNKVYLPC